MGTTRAHLRDAIAVEVAEWAVFRAYHLDDSDIRLIHDIPPSTKLPRDPLVRKSGEHTTLEIFSRPWLAWILGTLLEAPNHFAGRPWAQAAADIADDLKTNLVMTTIADTAELEPVA